MELEITERRRKDLLGREELELEIDHAGEATPSEAAVRKQLAAEEDLDPATVEIVRVVSSSGRAVSRGEVHVHDEPIMDEVPEPEEDSGESEEGPEEPADDTEETDDEDEDTGDEEVDEPEESSEDEDAADEEEEDAAEETDDEDKEGDA